ncbi:uncharacterized protein METZ01_LOCUS482559 [marine metagenome]|uniref:Uncharacterized protein n=1 Tax=marine metagenome TaxID=408172 RepID=A0A383CDF4_9ZZZZ
MKSFFATIKVNVVAYQSKEKEEGFDVVLVDTDSFTSELLSTENHQCSKEIKQLLTKTKKEWPGLKE